MTQASSPNRKVRQALSLLIRELITDRFKKLARDESLSRFISGQIDPALLIDVSVQMEREALELTEKNLQQLLSSTTLQEEVEKTSRKIQSHLREVYGEEMGSEFESESLLKARQTWLRDRVEFYSVWLSAQAQSSSLPLLAYEVFKTEKNFKQKVGKILSSDANLRKEIIRCTPSTFRLLMKKQFDLEQKCDEALWKDFSAEVFRETKAFPQL